MEPEDAVGQNIATLTVPEIAQQVVAIMAALPDGVPWSGGCPVRRKDCSRFPALVTDAGIYRDGALVGIVGVSTNLGTALRPLLERSTDAALILRSGGVLLRQSAVRQLFGRRDEAIIGGPPVVRGGVCNLRLSTRRTAHEEAETRVQQLQTALESRLTIEQANGVMAGRDGTSIEAAFQRQRVHARRHQTASATSPGSCWTANCSPRNRRAGRQSCTS